MKGGKRKLSSWNIFVKKIYKEGKAKNSNFSFKDALSEASSRKGEMESMESMGSTKKMGKRHFKKSRSHHRRTRKNTRKHR